MKRHEPLRIVRGPDEDVFGDRTFEPALLGDVGLAGVFGDVMRGVGGVGVHEPGERGEELLAGDAQLAGPLAFGGEQQCVDRARDPPRRSGSPPGPAATHRAAAGGETASQSPLCALPQRPTYSSGSSALWRPNAWLAHRGELAASANGTREAFCAASRSRVPGCPHGPDR